MTMLWEAARIEEAQIVATRASQKKNDSQKRARQEKTDTQTRKRGHSQRALTRAGILLDAPFGNMLKASARSRKKSAPLRYCRSSFW
jgi:hypothetical protein